MVIPHPFPYQGSKRNIAGEILSFFPEGVGKLIEPFAGSAAVSIAAACYGKAKRFVINDINSPLIDLWRMIVAEPEKLTAQYQALWEEQSGREREFYDQVRTAF